MLNNFFLAVAVGLVMLVVFMPRDYPLRAPPGHGFWRGVVLGAVALPADGAAGQDADAPHGTASGDEQVNKFHALQNRAAHKQDER